MNDIVIPAAPTTAWDPNSGAPLPAHIADAQTALGTNIPERQTVPSLSYEGTNWAIVKDGNRTKLQEKNADGDSIPIPIMHAVILNFNNERGRAYYPGTYNPAAATAPVCWSADGVAPDPSVVDKKSATCKSCPMSVKGSKITDDGREGVACSSHRMLAILPAFDLGFSPLRLKIAVTSDFDKEVVEHGWFAFRQYTDYLKARGVTHTALVVTKIKFDSTVAYPKLLFSLNRVLTAEEIASIKDVINSPGVMDLLAEKWTAAGVDGVQSSQSDIAPGETLPKPTSADHIAHAGTPHEVWWHPSEQAWVKPWLSDAPAPAPAPEPAAAPPAAATMVIDQPAPAPAAEPGRSGLAAAVHDGWLPHPDSPGWHYKGEEVVTDGDLAARYPPQGTPAAAAAPTPPAPAPEPAPAPTASPSDPLDAARADGWIKHPDSPGWHYKGEEVVADGDLAARYPPQGTPAAATAPASTPESGAPTPSSTGTSAPTAASPSNTEIPPEVQGLLDKWTGDQTPSS